MAGGAMGRRGEATIITFPNQYNPQLLLNTNPYIHE